MSLHDQELCAIRRLRRLFGDKVFTAVSLRRLLRLSYDALGLQTLRVATQFNAAAS